MIYWRARRDMRVFGLHKSLFDWLAQHRDSLALPPAGDGHWALGQLRWQDSVYALRNKVSHLCAAVNACPSDGQRVKKLAETVLDANMWEAIYRAGDLPQRSMQPAWAGHDGLRLFIDALLMPQTDADR